uniref:Uncharacterized protein n=2 Tax=Cajanus cajan TaxID=3821 RepID=A0A151SPS4_CAJCA|nr:hypothetical protein KK1_003065 [Cajanus cajan]
MFSGDHVTDKCEFQKAGTSITIPYLSLSNLCGFICSLVLYRGSYGGLFSCSIYQDVEEVFYYYYSVPKNLTSDHILFQYFNPEDLSNDVPFKFEFHFYDRDSDKDYGQERIKECGVFPVYASSIEIGVGASNAENELESISQINNNESQPTENGDVIRVGVGGSNNENGLESITQICENESQHESIRVKGSNNDNKLEWEQLLHGITSSV